MIDKCPLAIVGAAGAADVIATVKFAQARSLPVAIQGGGHNVAGSAVCDDGIVMAVGRNSAPRSLSVWHSVTRTATNRSNCLKPR